jgi:hypothetical protein
MEAASFFLLKMLEYPPLCPTALLVFDTSSAKKDIADSRNSFWRK